ncbi:hypothetical protein [Haloprofundus salinisoli]|uniref:hypothetical protein n=1 Tax=Haloprofundus salinisoli TaxID=2876193 RepID=UPI001CC97CF1|nr:hypothetical protein [Haloprofundus salinisoli]
MVLESTVPARGESISVSRVVEEDHPERFDYDEETGEFRYPAAIGGGGRVARYGTTSYKTLAGGKAAELALWSALDVTKKRLGDGVEGLGSSGVVYVDDERTIILALQSSLDREGRVVFEPNVTLDEVVEVAPREVHSTVEWLSRTYEAVVPVVVEETAIQ